MSTSAALLLAAALVLPSGCSSGGGVRDAAAADLTAAPADATGADLARDLAAPPDQSADCVTAFSCDARTAQHECGVTTATGQRYPDQGRPYCSDKLSREKCSCDLVRCISPRPLCPGAYRAVFRQRLIAGCNGVAGQLDGTCASLWDVVESWPAAAKLVDKAQLNVDLAFAAADYAEPFTLAAPTQVRLVVEQSCWFQDVSGVGNSGRAEVAAVSVERM